MKLRRDLIDLVCRDPGISLLVPCMKSRGISNEFQGALKGLLEFYCCHICIQRMCRPITHIPKDLNYMKTGFEGPPEFDLITLTQALKWE